MYKIKKNNSRVHTWKSIGTHSVVKNNSIRLDHFTSYP